VTLALITGRSHYDGNSEGLTGKDGFETALSMVGKVERIVSVSLEVERKLPGPGSRTLPG
jgi:hypothetical protein